MQIITVIESCPGVTAAELAAQFEVAVRTIYRDVTALQESGVPLYGVAGRGGGLRLVDGFRSRASLLHADEAVALLVGVVPSVAEQLGFGDQADRAARKVRSRLMAGGRSPGEFIEGRILIDPVGWYRSPDEVPHLAAASAALRSSCVLEIRYRRWAKPNEIRRRVEPLGLVLKAGAWYLMARSNGRVRTYRVNQIADATVTTTPFDPDPAFDLEASWETFAAEFAERLNVIDVEVLLSRRARDWLRSEGNPSVCTAIRAAVGSLDRKRSAVRVVLPFESIDRAVSDILRLGTEAEVVSPVEVREHLRATIATLADRYTPSPNPTQ